MTKEPLIWPYYGERSGIVMSRVMAMVKVVLSSQQGPLTRRQYKRKLEGHLSATFGDLMLAKLAALNGLEERERWERLRVEDRLENQLPCLLLCPVKDFTNRAKAAHEVLDNLRSEEQDLRRWATKCLRMDGVKEVRHLTRNAADEFFSWASYVIDHTFLEVEAWETRQQRPKARNPRQTAVK
ncbi:MAG: hypothetical protein ACK4RK_16580 [Gemmataceae bacterium]